MDVCLLPQKVLFLHGYVLRAYGGLDAYSFLRGLDKTVRCTMSESMKELLRGVGVPETRVRLYGVGHWGIVMRKFLIRTSRWDLIALQH